MRCSDRFSLVDIVVHALVALIVLALQACGGGGASGESAADNKVARIEIDRYNLLLTAPGQSHPLVVRTINSSGGQVDAKVAWTSSAPDQISIDAGGNVRSVAPIGSAQIVAEVDGLRSRPVLVMAVELYAGTLLVRDADVVKIGQPLLESTTAPGAGLLYDVWLAGVQPPSAGTVVLAAEGSAVAGRVVETAIEANQVRVRLRLRDLPDLLARYDINWVVDLKAYDLVVDGSAAQQHARPLSEHEHTLDESEVRVPDWTFPPGAAQPLCRVEAGAKLKTEPAKVKVGGDAKVQILNSKLQSTLPSDRLRVALVGDFKIETRLGLVADAGLSGKVTCELKGGSIPIPIMAAVGVSIPVTFGAEVKGEVEVVSLDISLAGENGAKFELGVDCMPSRPCVGLDTAEPINKFEPHLEISSAETDGLKIKLDAFAYFKTGLNVVFLGKLVTFGAVEARIGPKQTADFGTLKRQATDKPYASEYKLKFITEIGPGSSLKKAIEFFLGTEKDEFSFTLPIEADISESPNGTWAPDKTSVVPGRDSVRFGIDLKAISIAYFLLGYNVESIEVYRRHESELDFRFVDRIGASPSQAHFEWQWRPEAADAGKNEFAVFAVSKLPVVKLEIGSVQAVQVGCISASPQRGGRDKAQAAGVCKEEWIGNASGVVTGAVEFSAQNFLWEQDLTLDLGPGVSGLRPKGQIGITLTLYRDMGCTVTPERFDSFPTSSLMTVDRNFDPPKYAFGVQVDAELNIDCPGGVPFTLPTRVLAFDGAGELTDSGTRMQGGTSTAQGQYRWDFALKVEQPQPSAVASRTQTAQLRNVR